MTKLNPIEAAVLPLKSEAIIRAEKEARELAARCATELAAAGHDLKIAAPCPSGTLSRHEYMFALGRYQLFSSLTKWRKPSYRMDEPMLADILSEKVERCVQDAKEDAAYQYDLFVAKLNEKIGACQSAALEGNHVWSWSVLSVIKADGSKENWKTQMILNCSKLGKLFNQFPTRKTK